MDKKTEAKVINLKQENVQLKTLDIRLKPIEIDMMSIMNQIEINIKSGETKGLSSQPKIKDV